ISKIFSKLVRLCIFSFLSSRNQLFKKSQTFTGRRNTSTITLKYSVKKLEWVTHWDYSESEVMKGRRLDAGNFGEVFLGKLYGGEVIAIKEPNLTRMEESDFHKEAAVSRQCKHPNVLETLGICSSKLFILTEIRTLKLLLTISTDC
ncbi:hypothetical protein PMAYCL1PPCAC_17054, partial [Pristionchus mayeri]